MSMFIFKRTQQSFLAAFLAFALIGTLAVKDSPWHDHAQHVVDCALCHLQAFDADEPAAPPALAAAPRLRAAHGVVTASPVSASPSPYQGRAPPVFL